MARDIFISHQSEFKPWVEWLARMLKAQGRSVFLDKWHLVPGSSWVEGLGQGLRQARSAILVATPEAVNSGWVRREHDKLVARSTAEPAFRYVPLVFGQLPGLPFLDTLQCVDCRDPAQYRDWFHRLLCGLDGRSPGVGPPALPGLEPPPARVPAPPQAQSAAEVGFVGRVMRQLGLATSPPVMVTSPGLRHQGAVIAMLKARGLERYGVDGVVHAIPPCAAESGSAACFAEMGRQCRLDGATPDGLSFGAALERRIDAAGRLFLLLSGFENAHAAFRAELAAALRTLSGRRPADLRLVLVGGERLVEQSFGNGLHSFLSGARVMEWPHPTLADVLAWQATDYPEATLPEADAQALLAITGGHAGLVRHGLEQWVDSGPPPRWQDWALACPALWESWNRLLRAVPQNEDLRDALAREQFGLATLWPPDPVTRSLYWADLLADDGRGRLVWRCEPARQVGREVLA